MAGLQAYPLTPLPTDIDELRSLRVITEKATHAHWLMRCVLDVIAQSTARAVDCVDLSEPDWMAERQAVLERMPDAWLSIRRLIDYLSLAEQQCLFEDISLLMGEVDYEGCVRETLALDTTIHPQDEVVSLDIGSDRPATLQLWDRMATRRQAGATEERIADLVPLVRHRLRRLRHYALTQYIEGHSKVLAVLWPLQERIEARLREMRSTLAMPTHATETDIQRYLFRDEGAVFKVRFDGESGSVLKELAGAKYVHRLLQARNATIPAIELRGGVESSVKNFKHDQADAKEAIKGYQDQAAEIKRELDEAKEAKDEPRYERLLKDLEVIGKEVKRLKGLGQHVRVPDKTARSAAQSVRESLDLFYDKCKREWHLPRLAEHLRTSIDTGKNVSYRPASPEPEWEF